MMVDLYILFLKSYKRMKQGVEESEYLDLKHATTSVNMFNNYNHYSILAIQYMCFHWLQNGQFFVCIDKVIITLTYMV